MDNVWSEKHIWDLNTGEPKKKGTYKIKFPSDICACVSYFKKTHSEWLWGEKTISKNICKQKKSKFKLIYTKYRMYLTIYLFVHTPVI